MWCSASPLAGVTLISIPFTLYKVVGVFCDKTHELWSSYCSWTRPLCWNRWCGTLCHLECQRTENWELSGSLFMSGTADGAKCRDTLAVALFPFTLLEKKKRETLVELDLFCGWVCAITYGQFCWSPILRQDFSVEQLCFQAKSVMLFKYFFHSIIIAYLFFCKFADRVQNMKLYGTVSLRKWLLSALLDMFCLSRGQ